jgi:hypothetical protein
VAAPLGVERPQPTETKGTCGSVFVVRECQSPARSGRWGTSPKAVTRAALSAEAVQRRRVGDRPDGEIGTEPTSGEARLHRVW